MGLLFSAKKASSHVVMTFSMASFRQLQYKYHRQGLDDMSANADRGRATITESLDLLQQAKQAKSTSALPILFTEIKKNELISIYSAGINKEKQMVKDLLSQVNPSLTNEWDAIKTD